MPLPGIRYPVPVTLYERIYDIVRQIPAGEVTSYGKIAKIVGTGPRQVGYAMAAAPSGEGIPWHRVVNSRGEISARKEGDSDHRQRELLVAEGVLFDQRGRIDLERFGWAEAELPFLFQGEEELPPPGSVDFPLQTSRKRES